MEQLSGLEGTRCHPMFGGFGLYRLERIFGIVHGDVLYFRTDPDSRDAFRRLGMRPFTPGGGQTLHAYYEVPVEVLEEPDELVRWARRALESHERQARD